MKKQIVKYVTGIVSVMSILTLIWQMNLIEGTAKEDTSNTFVSFFDTDNQLTQDIQFDNEIHTDAKTIGEKSSEETSIGKKQIQEKQLCEDQLRKSLYAKYALLMDGRNRRVLFEKEGYEKAPMASTTKIMTLLVALENGNLEQIVSVSSYAAKMPKVRLEIREGEKYRLKDLLYSMMLESHNDSAVAIAESVGGSVEQFASMMNEKAKSIGANHTNFVTPNGLDDEKHYTTAYDLAIITCAALENPEFIKIIQTKAYNFHEQSTGREFTVTNKNHFLNLDGDAIGVKTGFTGNAGYCFVGAIEQSDRRLISVVLADGWPPNKNYKWKDTQALMEYGKKQFSYTTILKKNKNFTPILIENSVENMPLAPILQQEVSLLVGNEEIITYNLHLPKSLKAPISKFQPVGSLEISINQKQYRTIPLVAAEERSLAKYSYVLKKIVQKWFSR